MPRKKATPAPAEELPQVGQEEEQSAPIENDGVENVGSTSESAEDGGSDEPAEADPSAVTPGDGEPDPQAVDDRPQDEPPSEEELEYDALLHEMSEGDSVPQQPGEDAGEPLVLDEEPDPAPPSDGAVGQDEGDSAPSPTPRTSRRRGTAAHTSSASQRRAQDRERVLTILAHDEVQTEEEQQAIIWHEIQNADWTRRILTGRLDGVERTKSGVTLAVINYKGFRVAIPVREMLLHNGPYPTGPEYAELMSRLQRILMVRIGSEIDFTIKGHDNKSRSAVGSRKEAMLRKRQTFYLDKNELGEPMIYEGRVVQARVVAVAEKLVRVEVFGVECAITARRLSRAWVGDATEQYHVGDRILVRVTRIEGDNPENLSISVDVRDTPLDGGSDVNKCVVQGRYAGHVTDIHNGVVFVRLNNGVNAIAHSCYDRRTPGKKDDVSFSVTRLDPERGVAVGIITRIIKQNL